MVQFPGGEMDLLFEIEIRAGRAKDLYSQLRRAIADGRLRAGVRLPPTRKASAYFGASRNTVVAAYEQLLAEGYVTARHGSGTYVAEAPPAMACRPDLSGEGAPFPLNAFWLAPEVSAAMGFWRDPPGAAGGAGIDFRPALVDPRLFPFETYRRIAARQLRGLETKPASFKSPQGNQGNHALRQAITNHIGVTRAVVCDAADVVVTSGAQQAFDLLARVLVTPGETVVAVEDPGYPPMRVAFAAAGATLVPVPVDAEGLRVDRLPEGVRVICLCPSHQFPLGVTMSAARRKALVEYARSHGAVIVEDDYDGEFRYAGAAVEALRTPDAADVVFYVGTFSKCMLPSLRLGYVVAPAWARPTLVAAKNCLDWHCATPIQLAVAGFITEGHLSRHVRRMRGLYRQRRKALLAGLQTQLGDWLEPIPSFYGMHVGAVLRAGVACDLEAVAAWCEMRGLRIHTLDRYFLGSDATSGLVFGYGAVDVGQIEAGLAILREAFEGGAADQPPFDGRAIQSRRGHLLCPGVSKS